MTDMVWIGVDVGADYSEVCVTDDTGMVLGTSFLPTCAERVLHFIESIAPGQRFSLGMETGTFSIPLARGLRQKGCDVWIFDAFQTSRFLKIRQNKTDRNDARGLADVVRLGQHIVSAPHLRTLDKQTIRSQLVIRKNVVAQRVAMESVIRSVLRLNGSTRTRWTSASGLRDHVEHELARNRENGVDLADDLLPLVDLSGAMRRYVTHANAKFTKLAGSIDICRRWLEMPGVGPMTALAFYTGIDDPFRFRHNADVGPYLGSTPRVWQTGSINRRGSISKRGDRLVRTQLVLAAGVAMKQTSLETDLKKWSLKVRERRGYSRARTALARKLAVTMLAMWKSGAAYCAVTLPGDTS